jgi:RNA polymerase sigma-70 factor (ECF subfamily)
LEQQNQFIEALTSPDTQEVAFKKLLNDYKEKLYWHVRKIVIDHEDADDVLQNTFIKVFENIHRFKGNSSIYTWMYKIATNEAINLLNKKSRQLGVSNEEWIEKQVAQLESDIYFDGDAMQLKLHKAIAKLPEKQRLVFNMRYFEEIKYEKMSEILETSVGGLKASYHHAVKKIKNAINE